MEDRDLADVFITTNLVEVLLDIASRSDPEKISIGLSSDKAENLDIDDGYDDAEIFYDFYLPSGKSIKDIFGMDISTPPSSTQARFISHPSGYSKISKKDELHKIIFIAVPPWDKESLKVYNRNGKEYNLKILD